MKPSNNNNYSEIALQLHKLKRVLAVTHINPDGDALGSLCFFRELMNVLQVECTSYTTGPLPSSLEFLPGFSEITTDTEKVSEYRYDAIISLDCATPGRTNLESFITHRPKDCLFIEIDHHVSIKTPADHVLRIPTAASTTEILFKLVSEMKIEISSNMAKCLLTGIVTDTANFVHPTATGETMSAAASMLEQGANLTRINDLTSKTKKVADLKLWGIALSRLTRHPKFNIVSTVLTAQDLEDTGAEIESLEGIAGFLGGIDAAAVMILYESGNGIIRGSFRTVRSDVDVARLASYLGGGGHRQAAGFSVPGKIVRENDRWRIVKL